MAETPTRHDRLYIGGHWSEPKVAEREVINPATEEVIARIALADIDDASAAVAAATRLHEAGTWSELTFAERADVLDAIADGIEKRATEFAEIYTIDQGGLANLAPFMAVLTSNVFRDNARLARGLSETVRVSTDVSSGTQTMVQRVPVGAVLASVPWNAPLLLAGVKAAAALVAGCPVVIKVDVETPLTSFMLAEVLDELDLPEGLISILPADPDVARYLVAHPGIKSVSFTGSTRVGMEVMKSAADNMTRLTLELGGKSAAIILDDFLPSHVSSLYNACLQQTGQVCTTFSRLLVPASTADQWKSALIEFFESLTIGNPLETSTMIGPLVSHKQLQNVERYVEIARSEGRILTGGKRPANAGRGFWYEPTLVTDVAPDSVIASEEVFGPVIVVQEYETEDEAVELANASKYGLAAGVFSADTDRAVAVATKLRAGAVSVNNFGSNLLEPYGGFGASGFGREGGIEGIEEFFELRQIRHPASA
jgi:acyl-CoA reductase-like NAD-dependent aldehyde dehydrogenase